MTKPIYEELVNDAGATQIKRTEADGQVWWIPADPANSDYQAYLEHLTENPTEGDE